MPVFAIFAVNANGEAIMECWIAIICAKRVECVVKQITTTIDRAFVKYKLHVKVCLIMNVYWGDECVIKSPCLHLVGCADGGVG